MICKKRQFMALFCRVLRAGICALHDEVSATEHGEYLFATHFSPISPTSITHA